MADLILVPTPLEANLIRQLWDRPLATEPTGDPKTPVLRTVGFGPIAATARTAALAACFRPSRILLLGIAGSFDLQRLPVGSAFAFDEVACYGVGVGTGDRYVGASTLGWDMFAGDELHPPVGDRIKLPHAELSSIDRAGVLLTSTSAAADEDEAKRRLQHFPDACAEDMEGYGVAMAASFFSGPVCVVRGISNRVGDRDKTQWQIEDALGAACRLADRCLKLVEWA